MFDFADHFQWRFFQRTRWNVFHLYSYFDEPAKSIILFQIPTGFSIGQTRTVSTYFRRTMLFKAPSLASFTLAYSSIALGSDELPQNDFQKAFFLLGRYRESNRLEYHYNHRLSPAFQIVIDGVSNLNPKNDISQLQLQYNHSLGSFELHTSTKDHVVGARGVLDLSNLKEGLVLLTILSFNWAKSAGQTAVQSTWKMLSQLVPDNTAPSPSLDKEEEEERDNVAVDQVPPPPLPVARTMWALGAECYFTAMNKSGGLSFGIRRLAFSTEPLSKACEPYHTGLSFGDMILAAPNDQGEHLQSSLNVIVTPILGQIVSSYALKLKEDLWTSARYDLNVNSYESNMAFGIHFHNGDRLAKISIDSAKGVSVGYQGKLFDNLLATIGLIAPIFDRASAPFFGLNFQFLS